MQNVKKSPQEILKSFIQKMNHSIVVKTGEELKLFPVHLNASITDALEKVSFLMFLKKSHFSPSQKNVAI